MSNEKQFVDGFYPKPPSEKAPDYVIGKASIKYAAFAAWLRDWRKANPDEEWINLQMDRNKGDRSKGHAFVDTWKPNQEQAAQPAPAAAVDDGDAPF